MTNHSKPDSSVRAYLAKSVLIAIRPVAMQHFHTGILSVQQPRIQKSVGGGAQKNCENSLLCSLPWKVLYHAISELQMRHYKSLLLSCKCKGVARIY